MLAGLAPASVARMRFPLGELRKPEVRELAREARPARRRQARVPGPLLPGRHRQARLPRAPRRPARAARRDRRPCAAAQVGEHDGQHLFTVGQRKGLGVAAAEPVFVLRKDAAANTVVVGPREALATRAVAVRDAVLHRPCEQVDRVKLRYRTAPLGCRAEAGEDGTLRLALDEPVDGAAPGQVACLLRGDVVVGARRSSPDAGSSPPVAGDLDSPHDDVRRDPRALPVLLRRARPQAPALGVAHPRQLRPVRAAHHGGHAPAQAVLPGPRGAAAPPADHVPEVLPHAGHRGRRHHHAAPHVLRDARQLLPRRLLQGGRGAVRLGALARGLRLRARGHLGHGLRGRRGARPRPRRGGDRGVAGDRRPARADRPLPALGELLAGRPDRARAARARSSTSTAAWSGASPTTCPAATTSASSSTGTSSSCSTTRTRSARSRRCRSRTSTRAWASTAWRSSSRARTRSSRRTSSCR